MSSCFIAASLKIVDFKPGEGDIVIAADYGYKRLSDLGIKPDYIVGDFDSLGYTPTGETTIVYPKEKDDTDTILAVDLGFEKGCREFFIFGAVGKRLDHTISNIQTLLYISERGGRGSLVGKKETLTVLKDGDIEFDKNFTGRISVFAVGTAKNVTLKGLKYELDDAEIKNSYPIGVSNEFIGEKASISVKNGILLIVYPTTKDRDMVRVKEFGG